MDWTTLVLGLVLGSCVTSVLIWSRRPAAGSVDAGAYFTRVAMSAVLTAIVAGLARTALDYGSQGRLMLTGTLLGTGWMLGGLLAGWLLSGAMRRS
jgi:hypothetical protein